MKSKNEKKVDFSVRPRPAKDELPSNSEEWVKRGKGPESDPQKKMADAEPQKRLTLNIPANLHTSFKSRCVIEGVTIQDKVQQLIEREMTPTQPPEKETGV